MPMLQDSSVMIWNNVYLRAKFAFALAPGGCGWGTGAEREREREHVQIEDVVASLCALTYMERKTVPNHSSKSWKFETFSTCPNITVTKMAYTYLHSIQYRVR